VLNNEIVSYMIRKSRIIPVEIWTILTIDRIWLRSW